MKLINTTDTPMTIRGVEFLPGKSVDVTDESLAAKLDAMPEFKRGRKAAAKPVEAEIALEEPKADEAAPQEVEADGENEE